MYAVSTSKSISHLPGLNHGSRGIRQPKLLAKNNPHGTKSKTVLNASESDDVITLTEGSTRKGAFPIVEAIEPVEPVETVEWLESVNDSETVTVWPLVEPSSPKQQEADSVKTKITVLPAAGTKEDVDLFTVAQSDFFESLEKGFMELVGKDKNKFTSPYLQGNFAPVQDELFAESLEVVGEMPAELTGVYARVGANPTFLPNGGHHWFDGDGMVHACRIKENGQVNYCNRYLETSRYLQEKKLGWPAMGKGIGDMEGSSGLVMMGLRELKDAAGLVDYQQGGGLANTALLFDPAGRLLAVDEGCVPYQLRIDEDGMIETVGRITLDKHFETVGRRQKFTAHPKMDVSTGRMHFFGYDVSEAPHVIYSEMNKDGKVIKSVPIDIPDPVMMHDFAITENYAIFISCPLIFDPQVMVTKDILPFEFQQGKGVQVAVVRKDTGPGLPVRWFNLPPFMMFHVANAWEEDDKLHIFAPHLMEENFTLDLQAEMSFETRMHHTILDMRTGEASTHPISKTSGDFPVVPTHLVGRKTRYAYIAMSAQECDDEQVPKMGGVAKLDLSVEGQMVEANVGEIDFGPSRYGGEVMFVPREGDNLEEDDGFLVTYVHDEVLGTSEMNVYDATTMSETPVASVKLPRRVPYGFHTIHLKESQFQTQLRV